MKKHLLASTALIAGSLLAINAQAGDAEFYGQVNKSLVWADDGNNERVSVGDNNLSSTRFGFRGEQEIGNGLSASFLIEGELSDADNTRSLTVGGTTDSASAAASTFSERHARVGLAGSFGSVFLGRTSSATDGITEIDLGSVSDLMSSDMAAFGGAIVLGTDVVAAGGIDTFSSQYDNLEGLALGNDDRVNLVRYDSPIYNGFQASVAIANGGDADVAVRYGAKFGATEVKAGIGYVNLNANAGAPVAGGSIDQWSGSVSAKHDSGLNGTVAYGQRDIDGATNSPEFWYAKVGYDMGNWGFAVDYGTAEEFNAAANESEALGVGAQYNFGNGVSAGLLYRDIEIDTATDTEEGSVAVANMRVKF
jgi:predicted porin